MKAAASSTLDLAQPDALWRHVAQALAAQIAGGSLPMGSRLLPERELSKAFAVSRVTIRRALRDLRDRGLVEPDGTRGWFVSRTLGEPNRLMGFTEMAASRGLVATSRVLVCLLRPANPVEAEDLRLQPDEDLLELRRLRLLEGAPIAIETSRLPARLFGGSLPPEPERSLYAALHAMGHAPASADYTLHAAAATAEEAALLGLEPGAALLRSSAITQDAQGRPIELSLSLFCGDRYRFRCTLYRPGLGP